MEVKNKKIAVVGLGIEGKDVVNYLLKKGNKITVFDQKTESELDFSGISKSKIKLNCGPNYLKNGFLDFDVIYRSPGIRPDIKEFLSAKRHHIKISSAIKLFFDLCPSKIIGVTGTKGKGTTSTLIYEILKKDGKDVYLAGNIGKPCLQLLSKLKKTSFVILELSSFQLFDLTKSPNTAVVLNVTLDHLDWHKNRKEYVDAKSNIVKHQNKNDFAVINIDYSTSKNFAKKTNAKVYYFSRYEKKVKGSFVENGKIILNIMGMKIIGETKDLQLRGEHNWENVTAAVCAAYLNGAKLSSIRTSVFNFRGLEHRLEFVRSYKGINFYNDSFSTNPGTAIAAIQSFKEPLTLILGGSDKGLSYDNMAEEIVDSGNVKNIILIGQIATQIKESLEKAFYRGNIIYLGMTTMKNVIDKAYFNAQNGDVILFSPASASFGMFKDYKDRGNQFKSCVNNLHE